MNPEIKAKWIAALRSGEYKQAQGQLRDRDGFCCLGVLCDISGLGNWEDEQYVLNESDEDGQISLDGDFGSRSDQFFGIPIARQSVLVGMNDDKGCDFTEIADYIEREL